MKSQTKNINTLAESGEVGLNRLDSDLISILVKDGRASFADVARQRGISRAHALARVNALQESGVIALIGAAINLEKLGNVISTFLDVQVSPEALECSGSRPRITRQRSLYGCFSNFQIFALTSQVHAS